MFDPGRPFSEQHSYLDLTRSLEEQIRYGVQQESDVQFFFKTSESSYELPRTADTIVRVSGLVSSNARIFSPGIDFDLRNNRVIWRSDASAMRPDEGSRFSVTFSYRDRPSGLNDFTPGSVVGTLVRAISLELKLLYEQMDEAYRRGFIDTASGVALDNVVALLGVSRKLAKPATGLVTFTRKNTSRVVSIRKNTKVATESGLTFVTTEEATMGAGVAALDVSIVAERPGMEGNVTSNTIVLMPTPPPGLGSVTVTNQAPLKEGQNQESDQELRERAKFRLERSGNATLNAIKYAVLEQIDGVTGVEVMDYSVDPSIPLGEVRVRYSGDADRLEVERVVNQTRAAGVLVQVRPITQVLISGRFYVIPDESGVDTSDAFRRKVIDAIEILNIGESLSIRRLNALVYSTSGLADVAEAQLTHDRTPPPNNEVTDPFVAQPTERFQPDLNQLQVIRLHAFRLTTSRVAVGTALTVQLGVLSGQPEIFTPIRFKNLPIAVNFTFKAKLLAKPDDAPETIGIFTRTLQFTDANIATLTINDADVQATPERPMGFRPGVHSPNRIEILLQAATYPGLQSTTTTTNFPF